MSMKIKNIRQAEEVIDTYDPAYLEDCKRNAAYVSDQMEILYAEALLRMHSNGAAEKLLNIPGAKRDITVAVPLVCITG